LPSKNGATRELSVGIVGAGFGGVGIGIRLRQAGFESFEIFERGDTVGGVWRANTYPGAACDVPSHLYSFSFAPGHEWSRRYAPQAEILTYLKKTADRFGVTPHVRFGTEVTGAVFDAEAGRWTIETDSGESRSFDVLVTACGQLTRPAIPSLPGLEDFDGPSFHSAEWDHEVPLEGRNVAVVGTGASAIQFVPEIAPIAGKTVIYQRSAPWVLAKGDRTYADWERRLFERFPLRVTAARAGRFTGYEILAHGLTDSPRLLPLVRAMANREREKALGDDPALLAKATPIPRSAANAFCSPTTGTRPCAATMSS
jgi:cation diffusion facilitator CzcD-associated flavoprotein CzcO